MIAGLLLPLLAVVSGTLAVPIATPAAIASGPIPSAWVLASTDLVADLVLSGQRVLIGSQGSSEDMTPGKCVQECQDRGFALAGLEHHSECFCGNAVVNGGSLGKKAADQSLIPCAGNSAFTCGGNAAVQLYRNALRLDGNLNNVVPQGWALASSYMIADQILSNSARVVQLYKWQDSKMTIPLCLAACQKNGYSLGAVEHGKCGNAFSNAGSLDTKRTNPWFQCEGDTTTFCGGNSGMNVYYFTANLDAQLRPIAGPPLTIAAASSVASVATAAAQSTASVASVSAVSVTSVASAAYARASQPAATAVVRIQDAAVEYVSDGACVAEVNGRLLSGASYSSGDMTYESCAAFCYARNFVYSAVEYGSQCMCASSLSSTTTPSTSCTMKCAGNPDKICGGPNALMLFKATTTFQENRAGTLATTTPIGYCGAELDGGRRFNGPNFASGAMTPTACVDFCSAEGAKTGVPYYAGLEYGSECRCGTAAELAVGQGSSNCHMPCAGDSSVNCGGPKAMWIYYPTTSAGAFP